jgi:hypothetical protein
MSEEQQRANGTKSTVTGVAVYFTDKRDLFPAGVFYAFHRQYGDEERVRFHEAFEASWDRLRRLINQAPGRLIATSSGFDWWPRTPDYFPSRPAAALRLRRAPGESHARPTVNPFTPTPTHAG